MKIQWRIFFLSIAFLFTLNLSHAAAPPEQPGSGPGGTHYRHAGVIKNVYGKEARQYWIFEPATPVPESAPLIVFNHGWGATNPKAYGAWIEHIVRQGNIVVYPRYQTGWQYPPAEITGNAIFAVRDAIGQLQKKGDIKPDLGKFAVVGHSAGGQITANMAALAKSSGLPEPRAVMCVQPGKSWNKNERTQIPLDDLSKIPKTTLLLAVVGDGDGIAKDVDAKRIFNETPQIPLINKDFITMVSDRHGEPQLKADHFAPVAPSEEYDSGEKEPKAKRTDLPREFQQKLKARIVDRKTSANTEEFPDMEDGGVNSVNALDYYGLWKLFDGLCDAAFYGKNREYALGNTFQQRFMGKWSDGIPVKELQVTDHP